MIFLGLVAGLLAMHILAGGAMAAPSLPSGAGMNAAHSIDTPASADRMDMRPASSHSASASSVLGDANGRVQHVLSNMVHAASNNAAMNCPSTDHGDAMAAHGRCTPTTGSPVMVSPIPSGVGGVSVEASLPAVPGHDSIDRPDDAPSLTQLQVNRA
ncbi:hypothetical protein [Arthrobacter sp. PAMC 25486]|uniref:hypothetical protein n=1 Tax=Arthrobacter sp. PAMC 25486 TaxID=1494608 RepID=UPI0012FE9980|nr:hypothetical protein [Arthrobacter sp. PAMC 25486]